MRFSPTKLLQGLLCTTPILLLTLAACGGGGGSSSTATLGAAYTLGGAVSGVSTAGLVLRNNGGDDKPISSVDATYTFGTSIYSGASYNITVLSNPSNLLCSVDPAAASGVMPASNITNANVTCLPAYTIGGTISGLSGTVVLQNNGADNLLLSANNPFTFSTPVAAGGSYAVTVLTQPDSPARQICTVTNGSNTNIGGNVANVSIACAADPTPSPDKFAYIANYSSNTLSAYAITAGGVLTPSVEGNTGSEPSSVAADAAGHVYVTNQNSNTISGFNIDTSNGNLSPLSDVDAGTANAQSSIPTGPTPVAIKVHPSGKFAYVVNGGSSSAADANSISAYSIDSTGALARIDTDGTAAGTQYFIPARVTPISITINSAGTYAYVANAGSGNIVVYGINATSGALTNIQVVDNGTGSKPYSIAVDPAGAYAYVANGGDGTVTSYAIDLANGTLSTPVSTTAGLTPRNVKIDPSGTHAYVVNSDSGDISVYGISGGTFTPLDCTAATTYTNCNGNLLYTKNFLAGAKPKSISIDSSGQYAYVANSGDNTVSAYSIDGAGGLTLVNIFSTDLTPYSVITVK